MSTSTPPGEKPVALLAGPTASGKTATAVALALALKDRGRQAAVINADSAQVYKDLHIVSARPSAEEMQGVEHLLFGTWDGSQACSAAHWAEAAKAEIDQLHCRDVIPILVGGTGMYLKVLLEGIAPIPEIDPVIREAIRAMDPAVAYQALQNEDRERAALLNPGDRQRVSRALEVIRSTGRKLAEWQAVKTGGIEGAVSLYPGVLLPDRDWLYERCDRRFKLMIENGALDEVRALLDRKLDAQLPVMRAIGVPEIAAFLRGEIGRENLIAAGAQSTRNYAKRQYTWFRGQTPAHWPRSPSHNVDSDTLFASLLHN